MSLGIAIKGPEGIVLAVDSRVTLQAIAAGGGEAPITVNFDNATKFLAFSGPSHRFVGAVTYGNALIGRRTAHSYMPEFEPTLPAERLTIQEYAQRLSAFFQERWNEVAPPAPAPGAADADEAARPEVVPITFIVGGFDPGAMEAYGKVFVFSIPNQAVPEQRNETDFGMTWGGQLEVATRLIHGFDPHILKVLHERHGWQPEQLQQFMAETKPALAWRIPYNVLPLQDCIDLAIFLIRTTITAQQLYVGIRGVGGQIEVAVITRTEGLEFIQRKRLRGEKDEVRSHAKIRRDGNDQ